MDKSKNNSGESLWLRLFRAEQKSTSKQYLGRMATSHRLQHSRRRRVERRRGHRVLPEVRARAGRRSSTSRRPGLRAERKD